MGKRGADEVEKGGEWVGLIGESGGLIFLLLNLPPQVERQGLDRTISLDSVEGVPGPAMEQGGELTVAVRLGANLQAYRALQTLLGEVLEEQGFHLTPLDMDFHASIQSILLQMAALAYQLEELLALLSHGRPAWEAAGPRPSQLV